MGCALHDHGHSHGGGGHGHSHSPDKSLSPGSHSHDAEEALVTSRKSGHHSHQNMNTRAALIHVISDFVQSCGVFIAALVIYVNPNWSIIDPICTFMFSILVLCTTINIMKDALLVSGETVSNSGTGN